MAQGAVTLARLLWRVAVLAALVILGVALAGKLPSGTDPGSLAMRGATGAAAGLLLVAGVRRFLRALASPPPPAPPQVDASSIDVVYVCPVCGMRVRLEVATTGKPPRHCGEDMEPTVAGG